MTASFPACDDPVVDDRLPQAGKEINYLRGNGGPATAWLMFGKEGEIGG